MPKSTATCNSILALIFNATAWADIAENDSSTPATNLYLSLHTADPGVGNNQTTNETSYTNYARIAVARTTIGWDVPSGGATANAAVHTPSHKVNRTPPSCLNVRIITLLEQCLSLPSVAGAPHPARLQAQILM